MTGPTSHHVRFGRGSALQIDANMMNPRLNLMIELPEPRDPNEGQSCRRPRSDLIPIDELNFGKIIGTGSYGVVYQALWKDVEVAVKEFKKLEDFSKEEAQLCKIEHTNIVHLFGFSSRNNQNSLIMEFAKLGSLHHLIHKKKDIDYDLNMALDWAHQAAKGLAYLHSMVRPILHRDLKPENLLLFENRKLLKICDLGLSRPLDSNMTKASGSMKYMAPEVMDRNDYDESIDTYSWAIVLWELLARREPYEGKASQEVFWIMKGDSSYRPHQLECPSPIWMLIEQCWHEQPDMRPKMTDVVEKVKLFINILQPNTPKASEFGCDLVHNPSMDDYYSALSKRDDDADGAIQELNGILAILDPSMCVLEATKEMSRLAVLVQQKEDELEFLKGTLASLMQSCGYGNYYN